MSGRKSLALVVSLAVAAPAAAQHGHGSGPSHAPPAETAQFDFLVGEWDVVAQPHVSGLAARIHGSPKVPGTWKAWRGLDGWGVEDELRLTDASGNPVALTRCLRVYDPDDRQWNVASLDVYRARFQEASAVWRDGAMHVTSRGTDREGRAFVSRTRFYDITPTGFRSQQDRSYDEGRSWTERFLVIEATRVADAATR